MPLQKVKTGEERHDEEKIAEDQAPRLQTPFQSPSSRQANTRSMSAGVLYKWGVNRTMSFLHETITRAALSVAATRAGLGKRAVTMDVRSASPRGEVISMWRSYNP